MSIRDLANDSNVYGMLPPMDDPKLDALKSIDSNTSNIDAQLGGLRGDLDREAEERKIADAEAVNYTKEVDKQSARRDRISITTAIVSAAIAVVAIIIAIMK